MQARSVAAATLAALVALSLSGCGSPGEGAEAADVPGRMPNVVGMTAEDALEELREEGFRDILMFDTESHGVDPWAGIVDLEQEVVMTRPGPGARSELQISLWVGELPRVPANVPQDSWYYPHAERVAARGTDPCLICHGREVCSKCHEERLDQTRDLLANDPADAPALAAAVASATDIESSDVIAYHEGSGWYRVDLIDGSAGNVRATSARAREVVADVAQAAFSAEPSAKTIVFRWLDTRRGEPLVEIGLDRSSVTGRDWSTVTAAEIPWIADRYAVPSG